MSADGYHVLVRGGDAIAEVRAVLRELGMSEGEAGVHRILFVTRADQTVVMARDASAPICRALRDRTGWSEPGLAS